MLSPVQAMNAIYQFRAGQKIQHAKRCWPGRGTIGLPEDSASGSTRRPKCYGHLRHCTATLLLVAKTQSTPMN